jgi:hypothetical protein
MNPQAQQATPAGSPMAFQMPGAPSPAMAARTFVTAPGPQKRLGLIPMAPDSAHILTIGRTRVQVTCKDRRHYHAAVGKLFCMHPGCNGRWFDTEKELRDAHLPQVQLEAAGEVHLYGFWSNDDCNPPELGCKKCETATKAAQTAASPAAQKACAEHAGGVVGLLTPADPNGVSS